MPDNTGVGSNCSFFHNYSFKEELRRFIFRKPSFYAKVANRIKQTRMRFSFLLKIIIFSNFLMFYFVLMHQYYKIVA